MIEIVTHFVAFILGVVATISSKMFWWLFRTWSIKRTVCVTLNNFADSWEALRERKPLNVRTDIIPVLNAGEKIEKTIMSKPVVLSNVHLIEASKIAYQLDSAKKTYERTEGGSSKLVYHYNIDELAKSARECAEELGKRRGKR
jgi:hypothetical protein